MKRLEGGKSPLNGNLYYSLQLLFSVTIVTQEIDEELEGMKTSNAFPKPRLPDMQEAARQGLGIH